MDVSPNDRLKGGSASFRTLKTHPDLIGKSPFQMAVSKRFAVERQTKIGGKDRYIWKFQASA